MACDHDGIATEKKVCWFPIFIYQVMSYQRNFSLQNLIVCFHAIYQSISLVLRLHVLPNVRKFLAKLKRPECNPPRYPPNNMKSH